MASIACSANIAMLVFIFVGLFSVSDCTFKKLDEENWNLMLDGEWMIQFVAPWCPSCKIIAPIWERFGKMAEKYNVQVGQIDITKSPSLSGRFFVTSLPTIYHVYDGKFRLYQGKRDIDALVNFIKLKEWIEMKPASRWTSPTSYHMAAVSYFFRLSFMLKDWNATLREEYGFSVSGAYALFAFGTILVGALLGLFLVAIVDLICPTRSSKRRRFEEMTKQNFKETDWVKDDIEDSEDEEQVIEVSSGEEFDDNENEYELDDSDPEETFVIAKDMGTQFEDEVDQTKNRIHNRKTI